MTDTVQENSKDQIYVLASRRRRFFAAILDWVIGLIVYSFTAIIVYYFSRLYIFEGSVTAYSDAVIDTPIIHILILLFIITIHFFVNYPFLINGQTIGMRVFTIQVADVHGNVASIWRMYFLREIAFSGVIVLFRFAFLNILNGFSGLDAATVKLSANFFYLIAFAVNLLFIYRSDRRCIHDLFAGTIVIKPTKEVFAKQRKNLPVFQKVLWSSFIICLLTAGIVSIAAIKSDYDFFKLCEEGSLQQITDAIENGANVNARSIVGETPLMAAAASNLNPEVITALVKAGADVNAREDELKMTPLMMAAQFNTNPKVITALINAGASVNEKHDNGWTPLMWAAGFNSNPEVVTIFVKTGANVNEKDDKGFTSLIWAATFNSNPDVIETLIKAGADVNAKENRGFTSLMWAAWKNPNPEVIITLLENGADPKEKNNYGRIALSYARENEQLNNSEAFKKLEEVSR